MNTATVSFHVIGDPKQKGSATHDADWSIALERLRRLIGDGSPSQMAFFVMEGAPVAKGRARWSRRGTYTPKKTVTAERDLASYFQAALHGKSFDVPVAIVAVFYRPNFQRIDADNMMKLVLDAGTKAGAWVDDCYVTAQACWVEMDRERPRTLVALCPTVSTLDRSAQFTCKVCGDRFRRAGTATFKNPPAFCSRACRYKAFAKDREQARCAQCDAIFLRKSAGQRYCSRPCADARRKTCSPMPACDNCGKRVSRREYLKCSDCSRKGRPRQHTDTASADHGQPSGARISVARMGEPS